MNERIRELATQAGYKDFDYAIIAHKFAELIVRECANQCLSLDDARKIKKHFGVEE
jgi:hypothetical protein